MVSLKNVASTTGYPHAEKQAKEDHTPLSYVLHKNQLKVDQRFTFKS